MVPMELARVIIRETNDEQIIVLQEINGQRSFPIVIGIWEAFAIDRNLKEKKTPRPMTHDLLENVIKGLEATLDRVVVNDLRERTFYARLLLRRNGKMVEVDARPSDAIALAVQMKAPIFVSESVLDAVRPDENQTYEPTSEPEEEEPGEAEEGEEDKPF